MVVDKGFISNLISAGFFGVGLILPRSLFQEIVLNTGLFAFSGGITNSLAVKMLFDRIPGFYGSGVIPARFREIRLKIKALILEHFFDESYLRQFFTSRETPVDWSRYVKSSGKASNPVARFIETQWDHLASNEVVQPIIDQQIEKLMDSSIGGLLMMVGPATIQPAVTKFVNAFLGSMRTKVLEFASKAETNGIQIKIDEERVIADIRSNVDDLLTKKLAQLDAMTVKRMMEDVIRCHLGWLVVWGNVFGGLLGFVPVLLGRYWR